MKDQPEEWAKWLTKGKRGSRAYDSTPIILQADKFGNTLQKWWYEMQPKFCQGPNSAVLPTYSPLTINGWGNVRRGGPNGLLAIVTMVGWWGAALDKTDSDSNNSVAWR